MSTGNQRSEPRDRQWSTFRLWPPDRELLRTIAERSDETPDRYTAFQRLLPIVQALNLEDVRELERQPLRLGLPVELHEVLTQRSKATGLTITDILLRAARQYISELSNHHDDQS